MHPGSSQAGKAVDMRCHDAPNLLITHIPDENILAPNDPIIALIHIDITALVFGIGTC